MVKKDQQLQSHKIIVVKKNVGTIFIGYAYLNIGRVGIEIK